MIDVGKIRINTIPIMPMTSKYEYFTSESKMPIKIKNNTYVPGVIISSIIFLIFTFDLITIKDVALIPKK